jgi:hypothetical protein
MGFNPKASLVLGIVLFLLWLAIERDAELAGVAVDNVLGWGLVGFAFWAALAKGLASNLKQIRKGRTHG